VSIIPKPVWAVGFALEQTLRDATLAVFSFLILKRLQHIEFCKKNYCNVNSAADYLRRVCLLQNEWNLR
jgi:hypothetical protein